MAGKFQLHDAQSADRVFWIVLSISVLLLIAQCLVDRSASGPIAITGGLCGLLSILTGDLSRRCSFRALGMTYGMIFILLHSMFVRT